MLAACTYYPLSTGGALSDTNNQNRFRWVEIWLGIFFPKNKAAVRRPGYAKELLNELENFQSLGKLADGEYDESLKDKRIEDAYERLWNITDNQYKKYQIRLFQVIMGAFEKLTAQQLLEAVSFDPDNPDTYDNFELDELEGLYCNFLKQDSRGFLDFEHISAKVFVSEMKDDSNKPIFSETESHSILADIAIKSMERPGHRIWIAAEIPLAYWGAQAKEYLERGRQDYTKLSRTMHNSVRNRARWDYVGGYIFKNWVHHCRQLQDDDQFMRRMSESVWNARSALEAWFTFKAGAGSRNELSYAMTRSTCPDGEVTHISPLLCMVSLNFSPFSHNVGPDPALLPGLDDTTVQNLGGETALHMACALRNNAVVEDLLKFERTKRGSCLSVLFAKDCEGRIPMHAAKDNEVVKTLLRYEMLESQIQPAEDGLCTSGLLDCEAKNGETALFCIIGQCSDDYLEQIFATYRLGPCQSLEDIMFEATYNRKIETIKFLVKNRPITNFKCSERTRSIPALHRAAHEGDMEIMNLLLNWGEGIHTRGSFFGPVICTAVISEDCRVLQYLIDRGANINDSGGYGTALGMAASSGNLDMAFFLLERGADINARWGVHGTPLGAAVNGDRGDKKGMVTFLIENGADEGLLNEEDMAAFEKMMGGE